MQKIQMLVALSAAGLIAGCYPMGGGSGQKANANLESRSGSNVKGNVSFVAQGGHVLVMAKVSGLRPNSEHGFHVHEKGDCSAPDAMSAAGHFNPGGKPHGSPGGAHSHAGDLPNLKADANGNANYSAKVHGLTVSSGATGIIGRSVVIHRDPDDYKSQPAGNSGPRIACGVIRS